MQTVTTIVHMLLRLAGLTAIILGLLFWTGNALPLIPIHMLAGIIVVLALWTLAILALRAGVNPGLAALAIVWGLIVTAIGLAVLIELFACVLVVGAWIGAVVWGD